MTKQAAGTHWRKVHRRKNPNLLFAEDIGPVGTKVVVEVVDSGVVSVESIEGKDEMPWIGFRGKQKKLALNATNCKALQSLCGTGIIEQWRGPVELVVVRTTYFDQHTKQKEDTDAIRISPKRPRGSRSEPSDEGRSRPPSDDPKDEVGSFAKDPNAELSEADRRAIEMAEAAAGGDA